MNILLWLVILIIVFFIFSWMYRGNSRIKDPSGCQLERDGFVLLPNILTPEKVQYYLDLSNNKHTLEIKKDIHGNPDILNRTKLGNDYEFQDYILSIQQASYTCHRDNNRKQANKGQKHDSYTILFFLKEMDRSLDVIVGSHLQNKAMYLTDHTKSITVPVGSALLFNANLIHAGSFNEKDGNTRIQMKLTHRDDRKAIDFYEDYNKIADKSNKVPTGFQKIHKHLSCQFPFLSDTTQDLNIQTSKYTSNDAKAPWIQRVFSQIVYGNPNYFDLSDAT